MSFQKYDAILVEGYDNITASDVIKLAKKKNRYRREFYDSLSRALVDSGKYTITETESNYTTYKIGAISITEEKLLQFFDEYTVGAPMEKLSQQTGIPVKS